MRISLTERLFSVCSRTTVSLLVLTLPYVAQADTVIADSKNGQTQTYSGEITNIVGEIITIRTSQSEISLGMSNVTEFAYRKPSAAMAAFARRKNGQHLEAIRFFDQAVQQTPSPWTKRELQAEAIVSCVNAGEFKEAVTRIENILQSDVRSRHVRLLPLVWEERLPDKHRIPVEASQLKSESQIQQLVCASALLLDSQHGNDARLTLNQLRRDAAHPYISRLAECQLWRLYLKPPLRQRAVPDYWTTTAHQLPAGLKGGPNYILGRLLANRHLHEDAAVLLLWLPTMDHFDHRLTAAAMDAAAVSLQASGKMAEAQRVLRERNELFAELQRLPTTVSDE